MHQNFTQDLEKQTTEQLDRFEKHLIKLLPQLFKSQSLLNSGISYKDKSFYKTQIHNLDDINHSKYINSEVIDNLEPLKLCVALSGGSDSMFLLYMLSLMQASYTSSLIITVAIVDHGLRTESTEEATWVKNYVYNNFPQHQTHILSWIGDKPKSNIHSKARNARYKLLTDLCHKEKIPYLLTAHHKNDQAETVLLRITRGSGIRGIAGICDISTIENQIILIRPLLNFTKQEMEETLQNAKIQYVSDPSNDNLKFDRIKIRKMLQDWEKIESNIVNRFVLLAKNARRCDSFIQDSVSKAKDLCYETFNDFSYNDRIFIKIAPFLTLSEEIALHLLRDTLKKHTTYNSSNDFNKKVQKIPRLKSLERLYQKIISFNEYSLESNIDIDRKITAFRTTLSGFIISIYKKEWLQIEIEKGKNM